MISHDKARDGDNVVVLGNGEHNDGGELVGVAAQADARQRAVARHGGGAPYTYLRTYLCTSIR